MTNREQSDHLANLSDGAGCAEVWEHLSEQRDAEDEEEGATDSSDDAESAGDTEPADDEDTADQDAPEQDAAAVPCP